MPPDETSLVGRRFGHYEVLEPVGAGGMGMVFKARHTGLETLVALKTMPPGFQDIPVLVERFRREARVTARLKHPNIVQVTDFGDESGAYYLVMEFVAGSTLSARLGRALPAHEALALLDPIAAALDHAHAAGVVHRDLKPSNIMIDEDGALKVTDFGLARILDGVVRTEGGKLRTASDADSVGRENTADSPALSAAGQVLGTLEYMSPEQRAGEPVDARTDVYALAVITFEMLVGRRPRGIEYPHELRPDLPPQVTVVLHRALGAPDRRPPTAGAFVEELRRAIRPRRSALPVLATLAMLALAGTAAWRLWPREKTVPPIVTIEPAAPIDRPAPVDPILVTGRAEPRDAGRVDVTRVSDDTFRLIATAADGRHFAGWVGREAPAEMTLTADRSSELVARFEINRYPLTSNRAPEEGGSIVGAPVDAEHGRPFTVTAEPSDGWIFAGWEDGTTERSRELTLTADVEITATFERRRIRLTATAGPGGRVEPADAEVVAGAEVTFTARPEIGYVFHAWSNRSREPRLTLHATEPMDLTAEFRDGTREIGRHEGAVRALDFDAEGKFLVSGGADHKAIVWDLKNGRAHRTYDGHQYLGVDVVAFSPDSRWVAGGGGTRMVHIWDVETGNHVQTFKMYSALTAIEWTADGKYLAVGVGDKRNYVGIWDIESRKFSRNDLPTLSTTTHDFEVNAVAFSPDGKRMATGFGDSGVRIYPVDWNAPTWDTALTHVASPGKSASGPSTSLAWSSDGTRLVSRAGTRVVVWDTSSWEKPLRTVDGPGATVTAVAADTRIAAAFEDGSVRLWDAAGGDEIGTLAGRGPAVYALDFSPDGAWLATAGEDGVVRITPLP